MRETNDYKNFIMDIFVREDMLIVDHY